MNPMTTEQVMQRFFQWHDILYWVQIGQTIYGSENGDQLRFSVDASADGFTLAVGAPVWWEKNDRAGYVRVYSLYVDKDSGLIWKQVGQDINDEDLGDQFGESVSLSKDVNILDHITFHALRTAS